jgi:hypothetical protein
MNCFTGTSMMISEQWKAVFFRRECVEQKWILFSSEVLTVLRIRQFLETFGESQKASIVSSCLSVSLSHLQVSVRFKPDGSTLN